MVHFKKSYSNFLLPDTKTISVRQYVFVYRVLHYVIVDHVLHDSRYNIQFVSNFCHNLVQLANFKKDRPDRDIFFQSVPFVFNILSKNLTDLACDLKFHWYLRTLSLKFQKTRTKIEVFLSLKYPRNCRLHAPLIL